MEEEEVNEEGRRKRGEDEEGGELDMNTGGPGVYFSVVCLWTQAASPVLQLVHAGVGRPADAGDLLPLLPLRQLLGDQVRQQRLSDVQEVGQLGHHVLEKKSGHVNTRRGAERPQVIEPSRLLTCRLAFSSKPILPTVIFSFSSSFGVMPFISFSTET